MHNNIDNNKGGSVEESAPFIPFETAWASIKPVLDKEEERRKKKKRRFIIFWFFLIGLAIGWGVVFVSSKNVFYSSEKPGISNGSNKKAYLNTNHSETTGKTLNHDSSSTNKAIDNSTQNGDINNAATEEQVQSNNNQTVDKNASQLKATVNKSANKEQSVGAKNIALNKIKKAIKNTPDKLIVKSNKDENNTELSKANHGVSISKQTMHKVAVAKTSIKASAKLNVDKDNITAKQKGQNDLSITASKIAKNNATQLGVDMDSNTVNKYTNSLADNTSHIEASKIASTDSIATIVKIDSNKLVVDSNKKTIAKKATIDNKNKSKKPMAISYGLQFNVPFGEGVNNTDINSRSQPLAVLIPSIWVRKNFGSKHSLSFMINPYSSFYLNNNAVTDSSFYTVTMIQGSRISNGPEIIKFKESNAFNKVISIEATLLYNYQLSSAFKVGLGISNNWIQGALMQNKVVKNYSTVTKDSLYGIDHSSKEWGFTNSTFMLGKFEVQYQYKKLAIGLSLSTPLGNLFIDKIKNETTLNKNLFLQWTIK